MVAPPGIVLVLALLMVAAGLIVWPAAPRRGGARCGGRRSTGRVALGREPLDRSPGRMALGRMGLDRVALDRLRPDRARRVRGLHWLIGLVVALALAPLVGPAVAVAVALVTTTVVQLVVRARARARRRAGRSAAVEIVRAVVRELDAGATAPVAVGRVRESVGVAHMAGTARASASQSATGMREALRIIDPDVDPAPADRWHDPELHATARSVAAARRLATRHGIPLARLLDCLATDLADRIASDRERAAVTAGPALSGYLLAALPVVGIALGVGMGTDPLRVLTGSSLGGALAVVGAALCCAGLWWAEKIVRP